MTVLPLIVRRVVPKAPVLENFILGRYFSWKNFAKKKALTEKENIAFLNAAAYAKPSAADQEHMDPENHRLLAEAIYQKVIEIEGIFE